MAFLMRIAGRMNNYRAYVKPKLLFSPFSCLGARLRSFDVFHQAFGRVCRRARTYVHVLHHARKSLQGTIHLLCAMVQRSGAANADIQADYPDVPARTSCDVRFFVLR